MYSLLKGYVLRKPAGEESSDEAVNDDGNHEITVSHRPQQEKRQHSSSYGRILSWGFEGLSYLGGQVKQRVERSLWVSYDPEFEIEERNAVIMPRRNQKPGGSVEYSVGNSDTLAKIALKFDSTPSELARMNRLPSHMLYPGQVLYVPEKKPVEDNSTDNNHTLSMDSNIPEVSNQNSHNQGHQDKVKLTKKVSLLSSEEENEEITETFLKINTKYITDGQGVVNGVMLVTPQSVIFNPNVSEPLVMDRGRDRYSIKTPMSAVTSAALFKDIAAMAIHDPLKAGRFYLDDSTQESLSRQNSSEAGTPKTSSPQNKPTKSPDNVLLSHSTASKMGINSDFDNRMTAKKVEEPISPSIIDRGDSTTTGEKGGICENESEEVKQIVQELLNDVLLDIVAGVLSDKKTELDRNAQSSKGEHYLLESTASEDKDVDLLSPVSEDSGISSPQSKWKGNYQGTKSAVSQDDTCTSKKGHGNNGSNEDQHVCSNKGHSGSSDHDTSHDSVIDTMSTVSSSSGDNKRSSSFLSSLSGEVRYWLGVGSRNQVEDDHAYEEEIIPRPSSCMSSDDNLLYLCIRISKKHWCMCLTGEGQHVHQGEDLMNRDRRRREYWFAIPEARVEQVYGFFKQYCPNINRTLSLSEEEADEDDKSAKEEEEEETVLYVDGFYACTPPNAKVEPPLSNVGNELILDTHQNRSSPAQGSVKTPDSLSDDYAFLPEMSVESQILSESLIKTLNKNLPSRLVGHIWTLVYSTFIHGFSLKTMYRNMENFDTPMLIVVQDDEHQIFGSVTSCPLRLSEGFYGTGQSFLFKFEGEQIKTFHWQGDNYFFMKGSVDCIAFGSGGGQFGLWLDEDFYHGSSHYSETYHNETLSKNKDFLCSAVEAWTFL